MTTGLIHNIKNQVFIISLLIKKIKTEPKVTDKIKKIISSINTACLEIADTNIERPVSVNQVIDEILLIYPDLNFEKEFNSQLEFIGNKAAFSDVIINIIKNSHESSASSVKFQIKGSILTITDNGKCSKNIINKLNNQSVFTTKENGSGIGSQVIRQFCEKNNCRLTYSAAESEIKEKIQGKNQNKGKKKTSMVVKMAFQ